MAGTLTKEGARLLDRSGCLQPGFPVSAGGRRRNRNDRDKEREKSAPAMCPQGRACFAMIVLEKPLSAMHREIDMVTTPAGDPVAMVHCNNCTSDLNAWVGLFAEFAECFNIKADKKYTFFHTLSKGDGGR